MRIGKVIGESGHTPDTFSLDVICSATIQVRRTTNTVAVATMCGLNNRKTSELTLNGKEGEAKMSGDVKIRKYPTSGLRLGRFLFRCNEIELHSSVKLHIFSNQRYSQLQGYGRRNLVSRTSSPHIHTRIPTHLSI